MSRIGEIDFGRGREQLSTAAEVEKLKEPGKFELLATAVLCKGERDYRAILHSGLNAQGQPIKSPVDGFCRVPNSTPPHFVLVEHTVEDNLEKKWLFDHRLVRPAAKGRKKQLSESDDGDLLKAGRLAQIIKAEFPEAKFTVVLTTNQGLKPDFCLKVEKKAEELGVLVDFWDRSRIARFLDTEPEGQWLRKEYLGLDAEMLSESLLRDLCYKSLNEYRKQFLTSPKQWVSRQIDQQVENEIDHQSHSIQLLIGNSGSGKSAAAYQIGEKHLETGGYSLWLSENVLVSSDSLSIALDKALHNLYPSLMPDAGESALRLLKSRQRILLIADDVNRTSSPTDLLKKLISWSRPDPPEESGTKLVPSEHQLICPVWSDIARSVTPDIDKTPWIGSVYIGTMTSEEGLKAVQNTVSLADIELTNAEASLLAEKLGNDPVLIGFFSSLLSDAQPDELSSLTEDVIARFIEKTIRKVPQKDFLLDEYRSALSSLTAHMLQRRKLNPKWIEIKEWFGTSSEEIKALRVLVADEKLCCIEEEKLVFRHDRLREALLVESMGQLLNNATEPLDIFWEPYYAEIIGQAIVRYPQSEAFLKELCDRLPLALVEALKYSSAVRNHSIIVEEVKNWLGRNTVSNSVPESILWTIYSSLTRVNSPSVLEITKSLAPNTAILLARLRNGCTESGIRYFIHENEFCFEPVAHHSLRDEVLSFSKRNHKEKLFSDLKQIFHSRDATDSERDGALTLAGLLKCSELEDDIIACWQLSEDKTFILRSTIWAATQCCRHESMHLLDPLLTYWAELPDDKDEYNRSLRNWFASDEMFQELLSRKLSSGFVQYFLDQARKYESLSLIIPEMLSRIDNADVFECILRTIAGLRGGEQTSRNLQLLESSFTKAWINVRVGKRKLSKRSMDRLKNLWQNPENEELVIKRASQLWFDSASHEQLDELQVIQADSPFFYEALQKRIKLGDQSVVKDAYSLFLTDIRWLHSSHYIWCDDLMAIVEKHLQNLESSIPKNFSGGQGDGQYILSELLTLIPSKDAELLLEKYWGYLGYSPRFVQAALYIATPRCLSLAEFSIKQCSDNFLIYKHIIHLFNPMDRERQQQLQHLSVDHLNRLVPCLDGLEEAELWVLEELCQQIKAFEWGKQYLMPRHSKRNRKKYYPSDDELLLELNKLADDKRGTWRVEGWIKELGQRHLTTVEILSLIDRWLASNSVLKRFHIVAACLESIGSRRNLSLLEKYEVEGSPAEINQIEASTRFSVYRRTLD